MGEEIGHECGFALMRLTKPLEHYHDKYGTHLFGLSRMHLLMEKQRNRGQDGAGVANVKLDVSPGTRFSHCERSIAQDPIKDVFERVQTAASDKLRKAPREARLPALEDGQAERVCTSWLKENVPFSGELFLGHVRYGTDSGNSVDLCHPVTRESNWMTRNLLLAGNFNITNNEDLFKALVELGQHPRELSDTVMLLEKVGHYVDKENNDLYVKFSSAGHDPRTCFSLIAENINVARILRRASSSWDGGYCIAGLFGHGDAFVLRDPSGIRPAFFLANDEVVAVASEAPLIQTVFNVPGDQVRPIPPGQALVVKRSGAWSLERVLDPLPLAQCSFERIYFSRGNDAGVYRERERLGRSLVQPLFEMVEAGGDSVGNVVLSFIPNTAELAFNGLVKGAQEELVQRRRKGIKKLIADGLSGSDLDKAMDGLLDSTLRTEKVIHKDAKIRTFIQEDSSREHMTVHAYDLHYGTVGPQDVLVALDDSIVRGNTLKNAILRTLDRQNPKRIIVVSSCPQIRYPDPYGIDMAKLGDLAAFKAAVAMLREAGKSHVLTEVYRACRVELAKPLKGGSIVNHVRRIYQGFTPAEISRRIAEDVTPPDCRARVEILYNGVEDLHEAMPEHLGDWYFTGHYPTPGGAKVCCRAFVLWMEGSSSRCYGVHSAGATAQHPVLVVGSGGRAHALAWKLRQSPEVSCVFAVADDVGGAAGAMAWRGPLGDEWAGDNKPTRAAPLFPVDLTLTAPDYKELVEFCRERSVGLVVLAAEGPCAESLADTLKAAQVRVFGASKAAADAVAKLDAEPRSPVKQEDAWGQQISYSSDVSGTWGRQNSPPDTPGSCVGAWGRQISGPDPAGSEIHFVALVDGNRAALLAPVQVYQGAGAGAACAGAVVRRSIAGSGVLARVEREILQPAIDSLRTDGTPFVGFLRARVALHSSGPKVLGFEAGVGDPVAQAVIPLLECDLYEVLGACADGQLDKDSVSLAPEVGAAVAVVMTSGGYPGPFQTGYKVSGIERALCVPGVRVFHGNTQVADGHAAASVGRLSSARNLTRKLEGVLDQTAGRAQDVLTSGGVVLTIAASGRSLSEARERAYVGVRAVHFTDAQYRRDIAMSEYLEPAIAPVRDPAPGPQVRHIFTYLAAGVDPAAGQQVQGCMTPMMRQTLRPGCTGDHCDVRALGYDDPVFVTRTSAVGTKLMVAVQMGRLATIGTDLVAICANEIAALGAEPVLFHHHFAATKLDVQDATSVTQGIVAGCQEAGCALHGASTAELPGMFSLGGCDLTGFAMGAAQRGSLLPRCDEMAQGDLLIALPSSGLHSNGFSLVRSIVRAIGSDYRQAAPFDPTRSLGETLLVPSRIYAKPVLALAKAGLLRGAAHVSCGGLTNSVGALLPPGLSARLRADKWELPPVLRWLAAQGRIPSRELAETFNCGLGMVLVVSPENVQAALALLREHQEEPVLVGELERRGSSEDAVCIEGAESVWLMLPELGVSMPFPQVLSSLQDPDTVSRVRVVVLAGSDKVTPLQALIDAWAIPAYSLEIVMVASADPSSYALERARAAGIQTKVLGDGRLSVTELCLTGLEEEPRAPAGAEAAAGELGQAPAFSAHLEEALEACRAELLVALDDVDISLLTEGFRQRWLGKALFVHASLLPSFPGRRPVEAALRSGTTVTGCTVAFIAPQIRIVMQEVTRLTGNDTAESLRQRIVSECEWRAIPEAMQLVASGRVALKDGGEMRRSPSFDNDLVARC